METFKNIAGRNPMLSVFREVLLRTYETCDEPLSPRLEQLLVRLPQERASYPMPATKKFKSSILS
jgi:hypothetical protein